METASYEKLITGDELMERQPEYLVKLEFDMDKNMDGTMHKTSVAMRYIPEGQLDVEEAITYVVENMGFFLGKPVVDHNITKVKHWSMK
jgi:hypothetical protein